MPYSEYDPKTGEWKNDNGSDDESADVTKNKGGRRIPAEPVPPAHDVPPHPEPELGIIPVPHQKEIPPPPMPLEQIPPLPGARTPEPSPDVN